MERKTPTSRVKNPAAVELGRLGGLKGGKVRAKRLSPDRRAEIAKQGRTRPVGCCSFSLEHATKN